MKIPDYPHLSAKPNQIVKPETRAALLDEPTKNLKFLKDQMAFLDEHLTDTEKSDKLIAAKLEALTQKISRLEMMIKQMGDACAKGTQEVQALLDSFEPIKHD